MTQIDVGRVVCGAARDRLRRWRLRREQFAGGRAVMDGLYEREDPWRLGRRREQTRFTAINAVLRVAVPTCGDLLELGSGEGHHTVRLEGVAARVTGIETSAAAVARARRRAPGARFLVGDAAAVERLCGDTRFDAATACELLYYVPDPVAVLVTLQRLAPIVLVTNYRPKSAKLARLLVGPGWRALPDIKSEGCSWRCDLWLRDEALL